MSEGLQWLPEGEPDHRFGFASSLGSGLAFAFSRFKKFGRPRGLHLSPDPPAASPPLNNSGSISWTIRAEVQEHSRESPSMGLSLPGPGFL